MLCLPRTDTVLTWQAREVIVSKDCYTGDWSHPHPWTQMRQNVRFLSFWPTDCCGRFFSAGPLVSVAPYTLHVTCRLCCVLPLHELRSHHFIWWTADKPLAGGGLDIYFSFAGQSRSMPAGCPANWSQKRSDWPVALALLVLSDQQYLKCCDHLLLPAGHHSPL